jgi:hypothetical protein
MTITCVDTQTSRTIAGAATTSTSSRALGMNLPIRRLGAIEVPAEGHWPLQTNSYIARNAKRGEREQLHVRGGWLDMDNDPTRCWLHIQLDGRALDLTVVEIAEDAYGLSAWQLTGVADGLNRRDPMTLTLRYHGVYRRGGQLYAWFSGSATIEAVGAGSPGRPARHAPERLHVDLLFESSRAR